jgi:hypothetical protein
MGPRPERPEIADRLAECIPGYGRRLAVKPGITGLAQINLPPDVSLHCVRRKLVLDLQYIRDAGAILDLRMLLCSVLRLIGISGERATRWMRLTRSAEVPESWMQGHSTLDVFRTSPRPRDEESVESASNIDSFQPALPLSP